MVPKSIPIEPIKYKLRNLRRYMPKEKDTLYKFGAYLAEVIGHSPIAPLGFRVVADDALKDLWAETSGIEDGTNNKEIQSELAGLVTQTYISLGFRIGDIASATCPEKFAKEVIAHYELSRFNLETNIFSNK